MHICRLNLYFVFAKVYVSNRNVVYRKYKLYYFLLLLFGVRISLDAFSTILLDFRESQILALFVAHFSVFLSHEIVGG